jgi:hypothetical protein
VLGEHIDDPQSTPAVVLTPGRTLDRQDSGAVAHLGAERVRVSVISESRIRPHRASGRWWLGAMPDGVRDRFADDPNGCFDELFILAPPVRRLPRKGAYLAGGGQGRRQSD